MPGPPIRKPSDHSPPAGSPRNIAGHHVLHRPLMPRHPPNAQKNKQQNTTKHTDKKAHMPQSQKQTVIMLASTIQFTTNPPTPTPHHPQTRQQNTGQATRAHCPRTPTACHPHTREGTHHAPLPTQAASRSMTGVSPTPITRQANHPAHQCTTVGRPALPQGQTPSRPRPTRPRQDQTARKPPPQSILRKEVIQPHLPVRLPCYDFVPITSPTFDRSP